MLKPFIAALAVGFGIVWLVNKYKQNKNLAAITYRDASGDTIFAGPGIDPLTGDYIGPGSRPGTVGATDISN